MKNAINAYEQLLDAFHYVLNSWLNIKITERGNLEAKEMTAAACFLLDNLYAKEDVGAELSVLVAADLGKAYSPTHLMDKATEMRVFMSGDDFSLGKSPIRDYIRFVAKTEESVTKCYADNAGKLAVVYSDMLTNLVVEECPEVHPMRIAELIFLVITEEFGRLYREILHNAFLALPSAPYFLGVEEAMERIRKENND